METVNHDLGVEGEVGDDRDLFEDEEENTADERNENLSQADLSSAGSVAVERPPPIRSLVFLRGDCCRVSMACKQPDGSQVLAFCGHTAANCSHRGHKHKQISQSHARGSVAYYVSVASPNSKSENGRKDMRYYTVEEYQQFKAAEDAELEIAGEGFALGREADMEGSDYGEEYLEDPGTASTARMPRRPAEKVVVETVNSEDSDEDEVEVIPPSMQLPTSHQAQRTKTPTGTTGNNQNSKGNSQAGRTSRGPGVRSNTSRMVTNQPKSRTSGPPKTQSPHMIHHPP